MGRVHGGGGWGGRSHVGLGRVHGGGVWVVGAMWDHLGRVLGRGEGCMGGGHGGGVRAERAERAGMHQTL